MNAKQNVDEQELLKLIVNEVDDARDIYELAQQIAPHLPIDSFDALVKASAGRQMRFRDTDFDVESLREHIPEVVFPVRDVRGLVERLGHLVRMAPPQLGVDMTTEAGMRRQLRHTGELAPGLGVVKSQRMVVGTAIGPGKSEPPRD